MRAGALIGWGYLGAHHLRRDAIDTDGHDVTHSLKRRQAVAKAVTVTRVLLVAARERHPCLGIGEVSHDLHASGAWSTCIGEVIGMHLGMHQGGQS